MDNNAARPAGWSNRRVLIALLAVFVTGAAGGWGGAYLYYSQFFPKPRQPPDPAKAPKRDIPVSDGSPSLGPAGAPVTVVAFSDFQ